MTVKNRFGAWGLFPVAAAAVAASTLLTVHGQGLPKCDPDNGGIRLPMGFCALVAADNLGAPRNDCPAPHRRP